MFQAPPQPARPAPAISADQPVVPAARRAPAPPQQPPAGAEEESEEESETESEGERIQPEEQVGTAATKPNCCFHNYSLLVCAF